VQPVGIVDRAAGAANTPEVLAAAEAARRAVERVHRHRTNLRDWARTGAAASIRAARASAALAGADPTIGDGEHIDDPVLAGAVRVGAALGGLTDTWRRAPLQVLARLHVLAAADLAPADALGRPRSDDPAVPARLAELAGVVVRPPDWPQPLLVALVHGELLACAPFGSADGVVARAAARLTLLAGGLDPRGLTVPEVGFLRSGSGYLSAAAGYADGGVGIDEWFLMACRALETGAAEGWGIAETASE
jgi:hypothetical protein